MFTSIEQSRRSNIKWGGVRSSPYGINPFPEPEYWAKAMQTMTGYFSGSTPVAVWGIGEIIFENSGMKMGFPNPNGKYDDDNGKICFSEQDEYERYLSYFDSQGIQVFLQVEPGFADIGLLIDASLRQYGHHPSVIGFGVDVEWYRSECNGCKNELVTDEVAKDWEAKVKSYNSSYKLFLKHYDKFQLPPNYRGNIIFIDDTQKFSSYEGFLDEMIDFANYFSTNSVMFQIGYENDKSWWKRLNQPIPQTIGLDLAQRSSNNSYVGVIWVDFTLPEILPISPDGGKPYPRSIALKAHNQQYVSADFNQGGNLFANRDHLHTWETFKLIDRSTEPKLVENQIVLQADNGRYVSADFNEGGKLVANRDNFHDWEIFKLVKLDNYQIMLEADNGKYVSVNFNEGEKLVANGENFNESQIFELIER